MWPAMKFQPKKSRYKYFDYMDKKVEKSPTYLFLTINQEIYSMIVHILKNQNK